ncbi:MAG: hypothetical protein PF694_06120 [Bacteroidetes bacterium]|jgi:hypothetical protein|nr:hypothetical protein [Bacteroidota bacterium]
MNPDFVERMDLNELFMNVNINQFERPIDSHGPRIHPWDMGSKHKLNPMDLSIFPLHLIPMRADLPFAQIIYGDLFGHGSYFTLSSMIAISSSAIW